MDRVRRRYNVDLGAYRQRFLSRRIGVRMRARDLTEDAAYGDLLMSDPHEYAALLDALNINLSYFMRDAPAYAALRDGVLSELVTAHAAARHPRLVVWSAGCASGEEPYSVAMLLADLLGADLPRWQVRIHATDRSTAALDRARAGVYTSASFQALGKAYIDRYFTLDEGDYVVDPTVRAMVTWHEGDVLTTAPPLQAYDLILCRNVLIYYVHAQQLAVVERLLAHLVPEGYLMLGMAEMLPAALRPLLMEVDGKMRLYRSRPAEEDVP